MISSLPTLVVRMIRVFLKSIFRPLPSSMIALVEHLEEISCTSGWAFSTSSSRITLYGFRRTASVRPAAFAIAHIAWRCAFQRGDGMRLLKLRHVDGDHVLLAAIERLGQRQRGLGLADAGGGRRA